MQHQSLHLKDQMPLPQHYEAIASNTLHTIWRRKWLVLGLAFATLAGAAIAAFSLDDKYASESLVQLDFGRFEPARAVQNAQQGPNLTIDAAALVETEARVIRSRAMAERVVSRLGLQQDPAFKPAPSIVRRLLAEIRSPSEAAPDAPEIVSLTQSIAVALLRNLTVTSDQHSYLISVAYTAKSPKLSAEIANAFAEEYLQNRNEVAARREFAALSLAYGPKHPSVVQAQAKLDSNEAQWRSRGNASIAVPAEPLAIPTGPNRLMIIGLAFFGSLGLGVLLALLLERRDTGFRSDSEVSSSTGLRCVGMMPELRSSRSPREKATCSEAARTIAAATGLYGVTTESKVALITSSVPGEGKSVLAVALAESLVSAGKRVLYIDTSPKAPASREQSSLTLEEVMGDVDTLLPVHHPDRHLVVSILPRAVGLASGQGIIRQPGFEKLLNRARDFYDVIIIEAPPVLLLADVYDLRRFADTVIHVVRWNDTTRATVAAGLQRLRDFHVRSDGVVLNRVNQKKHSLYSFVDACFFYRKYGRYYDKHADLKRSASAEQRRALSPEILHQQESIAQ
jgi:Mrp family chromosome partitioning ATPase/capsular polysaccharide biosynthesis protein